MSTTRRRCAYGIVPDQYARLPQDAGFNAILLRCSAVLTRQFVKNFAERDACDPDLGIVVEMSYKLCEPC
jgi:hypothetical protein